METNPAQETRVKCEVCLKEIPRSEAKSVEAVDYLVHFCGLDCYEEWITAKRMEESKIGSD